MLELMQLRYVPGWLLVAMETPLIYPYRTILSYRLPYETLRPHAVPFPLLFAFDVAFWERSPSTTLGLP
jgi:hypothetical protein